MEKTFFLPWEKVNDENIELKLAKRAIKGNEDSFVELIKIHKVSLYKIAYSYVKDEQKALDIIQECTYKGLLGIRKLKNPQFFKTWITKILINIAINNSKKESKVLYLNDEVLIANKESVGIEEKLDLYNAIDKLRDTYKSVIILKYFDNMSIDEISYAMDIPANTVKSHLKRAKESLSKILKEGYLNE